MGYTQRKGWKVKTKILSFMLVISMVAGLIPAGLISAQQEKETETVRIENISTTIGYQDVTPSDWFYDAVRYVQQNGIFDGTGANTFSPQGTMTRAMYVTALGRMAGVEDSQYRASSFTDVPSGIWYAPYVEWAREQGISVGTGNQHFSPDLTISREEMATMTARYFEVAGIFYQASIPVNTEPADLSAVSAWAVSSVVKLWQAGLFVGDKNGNFNPRAQATRAEAAAAFMRSNEVVKAWQEHNQPEPTPEPTNAPSENGGNNGNGGNNENSGNNGNGGNNGGGGNGGSSHVTYEVSFDSNGGTAVESQSVKSGNVAVEPQAPIKDGHTFGGWYSDSSLENRYDFNTAVNRSGTLYAKWSVNYTISFESNGGSQIAPLTVPEGEVFTELPVPTKEGFFFQGWFREPNLSYIFAEGSTIDSDETLYAKYIEDNRVGIQSFPSYSQLDVAPSHTIVVHDESGKLNAEGVKAAITFKDAADPDSEIIVTAVNGAFTVSSATEDGRFVEGHTYELKLTDDRLTFKGQDVTTRSYVFSVAKQEVMNIPFNPYMVYVPFEDVTEMMLNGEEVGSPSIPILSTTLGGDSGQLAMVNGGSGTFVYQGAIAASIKAGDMLAIYEGVRPDKRTLETKGADDGAVAYVEIKEIKGNTYTYQSADFKDVLFLPDVLPVNIGDDEDGDPANDTITVNNEVMDFSDIRYEPLGLDELTTVDVGDFIAFYKNKQDINGEDIEEFDIIGYGRIISVTPAAEQMIITYEDATTADIENVFNVYQKQSIDGESLLSEADITELTAQIERQAIESGFTDKAANHLAALAMETDLVKKEMKVSTLSASKGAGDISVENVTVVASLGTQIKHIPGQSSGVSASLQIGADIVIRIHEDSDLVIHMTGTFIEEIKLNFNVNGDMEWSRVCTFFGCVTLPIPKDYRITANLDMYSYTGLNITAQIATVEHDKLQEALGDWDKALTGGMLGNVLDIATEIKALMDGVQDTAFDVESLKEQYKVMMENETDWVPIVKKELFKQSFRVAAALVEVKFSAEFVVSVNVNLSIGADFNYTTAKRFSATIHIRKFSGSSNLTPLPGDGNYQFTFYAMGTIGLRAGIKLELQAGLGSVKLNSIGISVEPGAYIDMRGYFYYQYRKHNGEQFSRAAGALFVELGIYLQSAIGAQLGDGLLSASVPVYENTWPLYTIGEYRNVTNFDYPQDDSLEVILAGAATSTAVPKKWLAMSVFDLKSGDSSSEEYDYSNFDIQVDNANFKYNPSNKRVEVTNKELSAVTGNLVITWKNPPLSFTSEPLKRTIPLVWLAREGDYTLQLDSQNGELMKVNTYAYHAAVQATAPVRQGYTFVGWYTAASGGVKTDIPSKMPAEDITLYAHWIANTDTVYTVEHYLIDPNTGTASTPAYREQLKGTTDEEIAITSDQFNNQGYTEGVVSGVFIKGDGSTIARIDYYATDRTMTFDWGYGSRSPQLVTDKFGKDIAVHIPNPTRVGYTFKGWSPDAPNLVPTENTTYVAQWLAKEDTAYKVVHLQQNISSSTYTIVDKTTEYGATASVIGVEPNQYPGFTYNPARTAQASIEADGSTIVKLYYDRNEYELKINYDSSALKDIEDYIPHGATLRLHLGSPTKPGYTFAGWSPNPVGTMPMEKVEYTAQWEVKSYRVNFDSDNAASELDEQVIAHGNVVIEPLEPIKSGYTFSGWYSDEGKTTPYTFTTLVTSDMTLYAKWLRTYTISFNSNGGSVVADQQVSEGMKASAPTPPTKADQVFSGWYTDEEFETAFNFETELVNESLTLIAKWIDTPKKSHTISFDSKGGSSVADITVQEGAIAAAPAAPTKSNHTFAGWYIDEDFSVSFSFTTMAVTEDWTLYAKWVLNSYQVTFNSNGGSTVASVMVEHGSAAAAPTAPVQSGYMFSGWYMELAGLTPYDFATTVTEPVTLYAKWTMSAWQPMADGMETDHPQSEFQHLKLAVDSGGVLYTAAIQMPEQKLVVMKFEGDSWIQLGNENDFPDLNLDYLNIDNSNFKLHQYQLTADAIQLKLDSQNTPYLVYRKEEGDGVVNIVVKKYNGITWESLGNAGTNNGLLLVDLAFDYGDIPYIAIERVGVLKYDTGSWIELPNDEQLTCGGGFGYCLEFGNEAGAQPLLWFEEDNSPTVLYLSGNSRKLIRYEEITNEYYLEETGDFEILKGVGWHYVEEITGGEGVYPTYIYGISPNNTLYSTDFVSGPASRLSVTNYIKDTKHRQMVGEQYFAKVNVTNVDADKVATFNFDSHNIPYLVYKDAEEGDRLTVRKFDGDDWGIVGNAGLSAGEVSWLDHVIDSAGKIYVIYADHTNDKKVTIIKYDPYLDNNN